MNTFSKLWNISTPQQAIERIEKEKVSYYPLMKEWKDMLTFQHNMRNVFT